MLRASVAAETAGIPSVSIVCAGFERQAAATARGLGFDRLALAVTDGHVDAQSSEQMLSAFLGHTVDDIVTGLTEVGDETGSADGSSEEPDALDVVARGTLEEIQATFTRHGWSDGSPIIPPTRARVEQFLAVMGHDPWRVLGTASTSGRDLTVWSVAVNAVMAGCAPEHLPVLLAATEILASDTYGAAHSGNTTGADALMILDGPNAATLGFNAGPGALREGTAANTSVGRWLRLYLRNVFGFTADQHDKATFGNSSRVVLPEDHETLTAIGWAPLSAGFGFGIADDVLTMVRINSSLIVGSIVGSTPETIVPYLADGVVRVTGWELTHNYGLGHHQYRPLVILSPLLARTVAAAGWTRRQLCRALFAEARLPAWRYEALIGPWSNLTAGRPTLTDLVASGHLPAVFAESTDPERLVPVVTEPDQFVIAVAGDPNRANAIVMSNDGPHGWYTARSVPLGHSTDLVCSVDGECAR